MVRWYQPLLLLRIGARALLATVIGGLADNRELQATDSRDQRNQWNFDSKDNELWVDFIADTGDGWDSSFAIASTAAQSALLVDGERLSRADLLLFGGDLVYPDPSVSAYEERTLAPYQAACEEHKPFSADAFAVPGNHDWYDGLHAFQDIFCHDSSDHPQWPLGHWRKPQSHSYFSWQLPNGWWLLAPDIQLDDRLNPAQRRYFESVVAHMQPGDRVIVIAPYPHWSLIDPQTKGMAVRWLTGLCDSVGASVRLMLTGDLHHYSRYCTDSEDLQLVTSGGGGAFLHPTHQLPRQLELDEQTTLGAQKCYPDAPTSHRLSLRNLLFPVLNWQLSLFVGFVYTMLAWVLETRQLVGTESVSQLFESVLIDHGGIGKTLNHVVTMVPKSPEFALVVLLTGLGLTAFNENCSRSTRILLGGIHTLLHMVGMILTLCVALTITGWIYGHVEALSFSFFWFLLFMIVLGGGVGGTVIGIYLMFSLNLFGANLTNAFSSLRLASYKNFVRMKFDRNGDLVLYPLGIDHPDGAKSQVRAIEPPIVIR